LLGAAKDLLERKKQERQASKAQTKERKQRLRKGVNRIKSAAKDLEGEKSHQTKRRP